MSLRFEADPTYPVTNYDFTPGGWLYKMKVVVGKFGSFYLVDGPGLIGKSNADWVIPNSPAGFIGQTGQAAKRKVELYGLTAKNTAMVEFTAPGSSVVQIYIQVEVLDLPGNPLRFVKPSASAAALVQSGLPPQYRLGTNVTVTSGPPETLFDPVPNGTVHVVLSTHGKMNAAGEIDLSIAGGVNRANCSAVFAKLKQKSAQVVWISGCEAGADITFCKTAAQASGCYIVAAEIVVPVVHVPPGMIDFFDRSMIKFFEKDSGNLMKRSDFLMKQKDLQFTFVT